MDSPSVYKHFLEFWRFMDLIKVLMFHALLDSYGLSQGLSRYCSLYVCQVVQNPWIACDSESNEFLIWRCLNMQFDDLRIYGSKTWKSLVWQVM